MDYDDAHLCRQLAAGDQTALAQLYDRHGSRCYLAAVAACSSATISEDAVQEVFMRLAQDPLRFASIAQLGGYLLRMAQHAAIDMLRHHRRRKEGTLNEALIAPCDSSTKDERDRRVVAAMAELSDEQREVVVLHLWEDLSFADIGQMLDISANTVASRWRYARNHLVHLLKDLA